MMVEEQEDSDYPENDTLSFDALSEEQDHNKFKRALRQKQSYLAEKRQDEQQHWLARRTTKARRDTQKKNARARKLYVELHRPHRCCIDWNGQWMYDDPEPVARVQFNVPNKYTCYAVGRRTSPQATPQELESLCNVAADIPHDEDLEYEVSVLLSYTDPGLLRMFSAETERTELLHDLVDAAVSYLAEKAEVFFQKGTARTWRHYGKSQFELAREMNLKRVRSNDTSQKIKALSHLAQFGDIPQLEVIQYLAASEGRTPDYNHEAMTPGEQAEYNFFAAETPKVCGPRRRKLKRAKNAPKIKLERMLNQEERLVADHSGLFRAVNAIVDRRAKAHHFAITSPNGNGKLFDYLLRETQSRVNRRFFVDPERMVLLQYGRVHRTVAEIVGDDIARYLECAHTAVGGNGTQENGNNRKPGYVNMQFAHKIHN